GAAAGTGRGRAHRPGTGLVRGQRRQGVHSRRLLCGIVPQEVPERRGRYGAGSEEEPGRGSQPRGGPDRQAVEGAWLAEGRRGGVGNAGANFHRQRGGPEGEVGPLDERLTVAKRFSGGPVRRQAAERGTARPRPRRRGLVQAGPPEHLRVGWVVRPTGRVHPPSRPPRLHRRHAPAGVQVGRQQARPGLVGFPRQGVVQVRVQTYGNGNIDREILISMVVDARVLGAIAAKWPEDGRLFASDWANTVARWCVKHHRDYGKPPRKSIRGYFDRWAERGRDKEEVTAMENFLAALSGQYDQYDRNGDGPDPQYVIDLARDRFTAVRMQDSIEKLKAQLDRGDVAKAEEIWNSFRRVDVGTGAGVDLLTEKQAVRTAFETKSEVLIKFGDPYADAFFGDALSRDEF